jgi:hypothetical protein
MGVDEREIERESLGGRKREKETNEFKSVNWYECVMCMREGGRKIEGEEEREREGGRERERERERAE